MSKIGYSQALDIVGSDFLCNQDEMFAAVMHDIKNSVQAQTKALSLLSKGILGELNAAQKEMIDMMLVSSENLQNELFCGISAYKSEQGMLILDKSVFDVLKLLNDCVKSVNAFLIDKNLNVQFHFNGNDSDSFIYADRVYLKSVISNIMHNTVNYAFENSTIKINLSKYGDSFIFEFENRSPVIPDMIKPHIFDKFVSNSNGNNNKFSTGFGLYMAKKIVEAHNGRIYLQANGTQNKFVFEIPCKAELSS